VGSYQRQVHFAPTVQVNRVLARDDYTAAEKGRYWCTTAEFRSFRANAQKIVLATKKNGLSFIQLLDKSYELAQELSLNLKPHQVDMLLRDPQHRLTAQLEAWSRVGPGRRGLEKFVSPYHRQQRSPLARGTKVMVCEMTRMGIKNPVEIAEVYAEQTRTSRVYSRLLGAADYREAYETDQVQQEEIDA